MESTNNLFFKPNEIQYYQENYKPTANSNKWAEFYVIDKLNEFLDINLVDCSSEPNAMDAYDKRLKIRLEVKSNNKEKKNAIDNKFIRDISLHPEDNIWIYVNLNGDSDTIFYHSAYLFYGKTCQLRDMEILKNTIENLKNPFKFKRSFGVKNSLLDLRYISPQGWYEVLTKQEREIKKFKEQMKEVVESNKNEKGEIIEEEISEIINSEDIFNEDDKEETKIIENSASSTENNSETNPYNSNFVHEKVKEILKNKFEEYKFDHTKRCLVEEYIINNYKRFIDQEISLTVMGNDMGLSVRGKQANSFKEVLNEFHGKSPVDGIPLFVEGRNSQTKTRIIKFSQQITNLLQPFAKSLVNHGRIVRENNEEVVKKLDVDWDKIETIEIRSTETGARQINLETFDIMKIYQMFKSFVENNKDIKTLTPSNSNIHFPSFRIITNLYRLYQSLLTNKYIHVRNDVEKYLNDNSIDIAFYVRMDFVVDDIFNIIMKAVEKRIEFKDVNYYTDKSRSGNLFTTLYEMSFDRDGEKIIVNALINDLDKLKEKLIPHLKTILPLKLHIRYRTVKDRTRHENCLKLICESL